MNELWNFTMFHGVHRHSDMRSNMFRNTRGTAMTRFSFWVKLNLLKAIMAETGRLQTRHQEPWCEINAHNIHTKLEVSVSEFVNHAPVQESDSYLRKHMEKNPPLSLTLPKSTSSRIKRVVSKEYFHVFYGGVSLCCPLLHPPLGPLTHRIHLLLVNPPIWASASHASV